MDNNYRENLEAAISEVIDYGASASSVSRKYGIPRTTLRRHIKRRKNGNSSVDLSKLVNSVKGDFSHIDYSQPTKSAINDSIFQDKPSLDFPFAFHPNQKPDEATDFCAEATLLLFDIHIPHEDPVALKAAINYTKKQYDGVLQNIILGGDIMDCEALSKFDKNKGTLSFVEEVHRTRNFLDKLQETFPNTMITYVMGNHEERLEKYILKNAPDIAELGYGVEDVLELEKRDIQFVDNRKLKASENTFFKFGQFTILHGHEMGICPTVSPAHRFLERAKGNVILGHIHAPDEKFTTCIDGSVLRCYSVGTLAKLNPLYRPFNGWGQGFAVIEHWNSHDIVKNYRIFEGKVY